MRLLEKSERFDIDYFLEDMSSCLKKGIIRKVIKHDRNDLAIYYSSGHGKLMKYSKQMLIRYKIMTRLIEVWKDCAF